MRAVDRLAPWGATALYDVILRGTDMLGRQIARKAVVVFSDGEDQGSHVALQDVERRLQTSDVTLYMIAQGRGVSHEYLRKVMQQLTTPTGGRAFYTDSIDELQGAFEELLDELSNQYLVGYQPSNIRRDDKWREIKVEVDGYRNVRARQGYRAGPAEVDHATVMHTRMPRARTHDNLMHAGFVSSCVRGCVVVLALASSAQLSSRRRRSFDPRSKSRRSTSASSTGTANRSSNLTPAGIRRPDRRRAAPGRRAPSGCRWSRRPGPRRRRRRRGTPRTRTSRGGRLILLVIDQPNIRFGGAVGLRRAVNGFIDRLQPSDRHRRRRRSARARPPRRSRPIANA